MEQMIWFYVGIIAAIIGLGMLASVVLLNSENQKVQVSQNSVRLLEQKCNFVCSSDVDTLQSADVELASGTVLYSNNNALCIKGKSSLFCGECNCRVTDGNDSNYRFDLNTSEAAALFSTHSFTCSFERIKGGVSLECQG
ncbi:MAG: hypothetical protein Q7R47_02775 [Candidatus Diapherotrites archaeon]|nr:hypothetical protein [Candidatus Diapherotrites archaeon]